ncbi:MAG: DUF362 domain-containing protein [Armatimonadota bacterium]|nr:DUF362 domain-containing protein [Armatimonadota bacterium]MCX7777275.1 DUF362 domain-containing protein [Armatimonadota bacterium]MDW8024689.1 DUF362 domain-containing protein [Armatimonadota bacterium]
MIDISSVRMFKVVQKLYSERVDSVDKYTTEALKSLDIAKSVKRKRIAITAGSRGIASISEVLKAIVMFVREAGGEPFVFPAMGCHGGATARGQTKVLASLGITEESIGAPILSTMDVEHVATVDGEPVFADKHAANADGIIVVNRVKHHPDIYSGIGSGLMKMMAVGMGKRKGAEVIHSDGVRSMIRLIPKFAEALISKLPIIGCVALIENGYHQLARIIPVAPKDVMVVEPRLLSFWKRVRPRLPFDDIDILIVERMGKDIMGTGMDTFVIGRMVIAGQPEPKKPYVRAVVTLDLTEASHGNAAGIGLCTAITKRLFDKIDWHSTRINTMTSGFIDRMRLPPVLPNDYAAIMYPLIAIRRRSGRELRIVRLRDTLTLHCFYISEGLLSEALSNRRLKVVGELQRLSFDDDGNLCPVSYEV